jgi:enamine deaminase RidA (YjgF/YER057c/UK114 family)
MADIAAVNQWTWQNAFGFSQAVDVTEGRRVLYCASQTSVDAEGNPLHADDMMSQVGQALDNLETVLAQAGIGLAHSGSVASLSRSVIK